MATAIDILKGTFGVQSVTPTDPGIIKLAEIRSGEYAPGLTATITPESEAAQLLGLTPDPLKGINLRGNQFLDVDLLGHEGFVTGALYLCCLKAHQAVRHDMYGKDG